MKASGIVRSATVDVQGKFLVILLYPGISIQWHRVIGCCCGRKRYPSYRGRELRRGSHLC